SQQCGCSRSSLLLSQYFFLMRLCNFHVRVVSERPLEESAERWIKSGGFVAVALEAIGEVIRPLFHFDKTVEGEEESELICTLSSDVPIPRSP
ncbi:hypothetical protein PFISCL1PPCAC_11107, partial [Pristionchus fissidentatus]